MWPITIMAFLIYSESLRLWLKVFSHPIAKIQQGANDLSQQQRNWLHQLSINEPSPHLDADLISQARTSLSNYYERRIKWLGRFIKCCPLLGLLGTVTGMESTFRSLLESGLSQAEGMASGISEALITTQYGLLVAIPGLFLTSFIKSQVAKIDNNLLQLHLPSFRHIVPKSSRTIRTDHKRSSLKAQDNTLPSHNPQGA